ncbi:MAG: NADP-dependent oxidoreductase [Halioglobus sp.]|nr:NADP-dependent oxidoreductase [Halioglobus sp.]
MSTTNRQWLLKERPLGLVGPEHFELVESPLPEPDLAAGQVLLKTLMLSFEPAMRGWLDDVPSYVPPVGIGEPMRAPGVCQVVRSENPELPEGTLVQGQANWQEYSIGDPASGHAPRPVRKGTPPNLSLGVFGGTSLTAYFGLLEVGQPQEGEVVLVSGAAGATGSVVAQIARIKGCKVIGIAGGTDKCDWLVNECKLDAAIDYKSEDLDSRLRELAPKGVNVFFDNVGGDILETAISNMAEYGRVVLCGCISNYNDETPPPGPNNLNLVISRRLHLRGFVMMDYMAQAGKAMKELAGWVQAGEIAWREDVQEGFENIPATLQRLYTGANEGKQLLKLADPQ